MRRFARLIAMSISLGPVSALAWGVEGHRVVAEIAEAQLSPPARAVTARLLAQEAGATLASVSTWADEVRRPGRGPMHYVNFPDGECSYSRRRDCPNGRCAAASS